MLIEHNGLDGALECFAVSDKTSAVKIYPNDKTLIVGNTHMKEVYRLLKAAWFDVSELQKYSFPLQAHRRALLPGTVYSWDGWRKIG